MADRRIIPLIMCGGAGTRLWPASREVRPKQFLPLFGARSTFQDTLLRVSDAACSSVRSSSPTRPIASWCWSSSPRSASRPTCCWSRCGATPGRRSRPVPCLRRRATLTPWCWRSPPITWCAIPRPLSRPAGRDWWRPQTGRIVTFGVKPERAATEYGYISPGETVSGEVRAVAKFVEKPDQPTAAGYIKSRLSLEQRQLHVPRLGAARRIPQVRCRQRRGRYRSRYQSRARSRLRHARSRVLSVPRRRSRSTMR